MLMRGARRQPWPSCVLIFIIAAGCGGGPNNGGSPTPTVPVSCPAGPVVLNTGLWGSSTVLAQWDPDDDWTGFDPLGVYNNGNSLGADVAGVLTGNISGQSFDTLPNSAWLQAHVALNIAHWHYELAFCLPTGFTNAELDLDFLARDEGSVALNGSPLFGPGGSTTLPATHVQTTNQADFVVGTNVLSVEVTNNNFINALLDLAGEVTYDTPPPIDLELSKAVDDPMPLEGSNVTFVLTLENTSSVNATTIGVTDLLPSGLTFVSANPSTGTYNATSGLWTVPQLAALGSATLTVVAQVDSGTAGSVITNSAEVTGAGQIDLDSTPDNDEPTEDDQASVSLTPELPVYVDLSIAKTVGNTSVNEANLVGYQVMVTNHGSVMATNVEVTDPIPAGLSFSNYWPTVGTYTPGTGVWSIPGIAAGATVTLQYFATVDYGTAGTSITNTAEITMAGELDPDSTPNNHLSSEDDQASITINVGAPLADLSLSQVVSNANPNEGDTVIFTVSLNNATGANVSNIEVEDLLPTGLTLVSAAATSGTYTAGNGIWLVPVMSYYQTKVLTLTATVDAGTAGATLTNIAELIASVFPDPDSTPNNHVTTEDDYAALDVQVAQSMIDLELSKTASTTTPNEGDTVSFTIDLFNNSAWQATGVEVTDLLPPGLTLTTAVATQGSWSGITGVWSVGTLPPLTTATLIVAATVDAGIGGTQVTNNAEVSAAQELDVDSTPNNAAVASEDDDAAVTLAVQPTVDLELSKAVENPKPFNNTSNNLYFIKVTNTSGTAGTNIVIRDVLPAGTSYVSDSATAGSYNSGTGDWSIPSLAGSSNATLTITFAIAPAAKGLIVRNKAEVVAADQVDPDSTPNNAVITEDDYAYVDITVQ